MHARYYSPAMVRFLSVDPIMSAVPANPQSWNRYAYAPNNPMKLTDPGSDLGVATVHGGERVRNAQTYSAHCSAASLIQV